MARRYYDQFRVPRVESIVAVQGKRITTEIQTPGAEVYFRGRVGPDTALVTHRDFVTKDGSEILSVHKYVEKIARPPDDLLGDLMFYEYEVIGSPIPLDEGTLQRIKEEIIIFLENKLG